MALDNVFSIVTYNLHGFNLGSILLKDLLLSNDIIYVQEHWLSSDNLAQLSLIAQSHHVFSNTAMDKNRARPHGGLAIFIKYELCKSAVLLHSSERCILVRISDFAICNVYLPCGTKEDYCDALDHISSYLDLYCNNLKLIVCGDFNAQFNSDNKYWSLLSKCFGKFNVVETDSLIENFKTAYTYRHNGLNVSSFIDHFAVSINICSVVMSVEI